MIEELILRLVYIDESGTSARESVALVSGVCVDPDRHMVALEDHLTTLADRHVPAEKRKGFVFHATEVFSGGRVFDRQRFPPPVRWPILEEIVALPLTNNVAVVSGFIYKRRHDDQDELTHHAMAFLWCLLGIEMHMRTRLGRDEVAVLVVEDKPEARRALRRSREILADDRFARLQPPNIQQFIPLKRIKDAIHFAKKDESPMLQLADACAFVMRRQLEGAKSNDAFAKALFGDQGQPQFTEQTAAGVFDINAKEVTQAEAEERAQERFHPSLFEDRTGPTAPVRGPMSDWVSPETVRRRNLEAIMSGTKPYVAGSEPRVYVQISPSYEHLRVEYGPEGMIFTAPPHREADALSWAKDAAHKRNLDQIFVDRPLPPG